MKILIMHGSYGSPDANWFRWLEKELVVLGQEVILQQFPSDNWDEINALGLENRDNFQPVQSLTSWTAFFENNILPQIKNEPFIIVSHSIAPIFFLQMVEKHGISPRAAIFVAPFFDLGDNEDIWQFWPVNKTFYRSDFNFQDLQKHIPLSYVIYGDNDPYVPIKQPIEFAKKLHSTAIVVKDGGHLGGAFTELPIVLETVKKVLDA